MSKIPVFVISNYEGIYHVPVSEILHIDALGACSTVFFRNTKATISKNLKTITTELVMLKAAASFIRVHHSHIINKDHIIHYEKRNKKVELVNGEKIPLAKRRITMFEKIFKK